ncbi:angiopoietin-related protein 7 [Drosophila virilis]|uniref:Fibrinogen C-terminal domain-containing protein n=1 Tax=Drosophila virilis TaxID=7244 RepID=A0A0Q9W391_DROVI|nr:angiopoietin-related protein 7 [Drosophila virilis]KRF79346.1 uncharacterized protein Dvir_GJ26600 [Drosophila virilis]
MLQHLKVCAAFLTILIAVISGSNAYDCTTSVFPKSCLPAGVQSIKVKGEVPFFVACDSVTAGIGWTVIQRRTDGSVDFFRNWSEYAQGFGSSDGEYWIGLRKLHKMTNSQRHELYVKLVDQNDEVRYARYDNFVIGSEKDKFRLVSTGEYSGDAGDSLNAHIGSAFSTKDQDNDSLPDMNCAKALIGGWWYFYCADSNLNGFSFDCQMEDSNDLELDGCIYWNGWHGRSYSLKSVQMMIRPFEAEKLT